MNWQRHCILGLIAASWLYSQSASAAAASAQNPYGPIVTRNVFGLVPIPTNVPVAEGPPEVPPPKITPNGIMTLFGKLQVLFKVAGVAHPGQPPKDESYVLSEGDRQDDIEVQAIDEKNATITFDNHGVVQKLTLVEGKASAGDAPPAGGGLMRPGMPAPGMTPTAGGNTPIGFGGRFGRARPVPGASSPDAGNPNLNTGDSAGNSRIYNPGAVTVPPEQQLTAEQQVLMIEAQRLKYQQEGNPMANLLPPTSMTPQVNGNGGNGAPVGGPPVPGD